MIEPENPTPENPDVTPAEGPGTPDSLAPAAVTVDETGSDNEPVELPSGNTLLYVDGNTVLETPDGSRYEAGSDVHDTVIALSNLYPDRF